MKPVRATTEWEGCKGIPPKKRGPRGGGPRRGGGLAWHRGHHAGIYDAYLTVKQEHPRVAEKLRRAFGMEEDGSINLSGKGAE